MGNLLSIFGLGQTFTAQDFEDVSKKPELMEKFTTIDKESLTSALLMCNLDSLKEKITNYVIEYLDIEKLKSNHHSDMWSADLELPVDPHELRGVVQAVIEKMFEVSDKEKEDKDLGSYIKRILGNLTNSELGGFIVDDQRKVKDTKTLNYLRARKSTVMRRFLSRVKQAGFVFCPEHDQELIQDIPGLKALRLNSAVHVGNMAKVIYHTEHLTVTEVSPEVVMARMSEKKFPTAEYDKFQDRFAVVHVQGPKGTLAENGFHAICCHLKSVGNKKDITEKNLQEYAFVKTVVQSFDEDLVLLGDFNCPGTFEEAISHFGLEEKHRANYPLQDGGADSPHNITFGLTRISTYEQKDIAGKVRSPNCAYNSQASRGKFGERFYTTDGVWGRFKVELAIQSQLYPLPRDGETLYLPLIVGTEQDWCSDHQAVITEVNGFQIYVCNTLSDCASEEQPFKDEVTGAQVDVARRLMNEYTAELVSDIVDADEAMEDTADEMETDDEMDTDN